MNITRFFILAIYMVCACTSKENTQQIQVIASGVDIISYSIADDGDRSWVVRPEVNPQQLFLECESNVNNPVRFVTDRDTIHFDVHVGDTIRFAIVMMEQDTAFTEIIGLRKNVNFNKDYRALYGGSFSVEIPEVHELINIAVALSTIGQQDSNLVDMTTPYYREVINCFLPFSKHPFIETINKHITEVLGSESYNYYYALKMNACGYSFTDTDFIINDGTIYKMGFSNHPDPIEAIIDLLMDFSRTTNFRDFYQSQLGYYETLKQDYRTLNPVDQMWVWLEKQFPEKYNHYHVTFSPLVYGAHSAQTYFDNGFRQISMFVAPSIWYESDNRYQNEMINSRVVFTEIDHGYVNPISSVYAQEINKLFHERQKWARDEVTGYYPDPVSLFNEYMTWAVYSLYCLDTYPEKEVYNFIESMERQMVERRGFLNFKAFNRKVISLYSKNKNVKTVAELYPDILGSI